MQNTNKGSFSLPNITPKTDKPPHEKVELTTTTKSSDAPQLMEPDKKLVSVYGADNDGFLSYAEFRQRYKTIFEQVTQKDHLMVGRVEFSVTIAGSTFVIRTLSSAEREFINRLTAAEPVTRDRLQWFMLLFAIESINGGSMPLPAVSRFKSDKKGSSSDTSPEDWLQSEAVNAKLTMLQNMDDSLVDLLYAVYLDLVQAKELALREDLKNR